MTQISSFFKNFKNPYFKHDVLTLADISRSHRGSINRIKEMISLAKSSGAKGIKLNSQKMGQNSESSDTPATFISSSFSFTKEVSDFCKEISMIFVSCPRDLETVSYLEKLGVDAIEIASSDLNYLQLVEAVASTKIPILLTTGRSSLDEVQTAVKWIENVSHNPKLSILHGSYPNQLENSSTHLRVLRLLSEQFLYPIGLYDQTHLLEVPCLAQALGAQVIERVFTDVRSTEEERASQLGIGPDAWKEMESALQKGQNLLGEKIKSVSDEDLEIRSKLRRSLKSSTDIRSGDFIKPENTVFQFPEEEQGIPPQNWDSINGMRAKRDFSADETIFLSDLEP